MPPKTETEMNQRIRHNLKALRLFMGLSAQTWGKSVGVSETLVYLTEDGSRRVTTEYMESVCKAFRVSLDRILGGIPEQFTDFYGTDKP